MVRARAWWAGERGGARSPKGMPLCSLEILPAAYQEGTLSAPALVSSCTGTHTSSATSQIAGRQCHTGPHVNEKESGSCCAYRV